MDAQPWHLGPVPHTSLDDGIEAFRRHGMVVGEPRMLDLGPYEDVSKQSSGVRAAGILLLGTLLVELARIQPALRFKPTYFRDLVMWQLENCRTLKPDMKGMSRAVFAKITGTKLITVVSHWRRVLRSSEALDQATGQLSPADCTQLLKYIDRARPSSGSSGRQLRAQKSDISDLSDLSFGSAVDGLLADASPIASDGSFAADADDDLLGMLHSCEPSSSKKLKVAGNAGDRISAQALKAAESCKAPPARGAQSKAIMKRPAKGTANIKDSPGPLGRVKLSTCTHKSYVCYFLTSTGKWPLVVEVSETYAADHAAIATKIFDAIAKKGLSKADAVALRDDLVRESHGFDEKDDEAAVDSSSDDIVDERNWWSDC